MPENDISTYVAQFSYAGIFLWFLLFEQMTPVPEEVSLMSLGYIAVHNHLDPVTCGLIALAGLLICDNFLFYLSMKGNKWVQKLVGRMNENLLTKFRSQLQKNASRTLFVSALLPKLRFLSPLIAAAMDVSWKKFLIINSVAAILYVTVYMLIGIFFHNQLDSILADMQLLSHGIFALLMLALVIIVIWKVPRLFVGKK